MTRVPNEIPEYLPSGKQWRLGETPWRAEDALPAPSTRVLIDNDFSGDPDDLYQLVHHLLSPSVEIRGVIASHLSPGDPFDSSEQQATNATQVARDVFARMGLISTELIVTGAEQALHTRDEPQDSPAARAIITEAMRDDVDTPLLYLAGGGLTDLASAYLIEPRIASRLTLIWIGGNEHDGLAIPPSDAMPIEYNLLIDIKAAQVLFAASELEIWQIPRNIYRQCLVSETELRRRVRNTGPLGQYLYDETFEVYRRIHEQNRPFGETYALGDSPLVLLSALKSAFEPDTSSSFHIEKPTVHITDDGAYRAVRGERPMRVYTHVDVRLMFEDMFLKLEEFAVWQRD